ncbi:MAG: tetratricopeptide repeat protein [Magnetococcales bacterium]|nr:tetratricopeptide repeat protein [Magnetococcales bacterium]
MNQATATIAERLALALERHQSGCLQEAETLYRQILQQDPNHPEALHLFGVLAYQSGHHEVARQCLERALVYRPDGLETHYNLANVYKILGNGERAATHYRRVRALAGAIPQACFYAGNGLKELGCLEDAVACYRQVIQEAPDHAGAYEQLGWVLVRQRRSEDAVAVLQKALQLVPDHGDVLSNLGAAFHQQGRYETALACFSRALALMPDTPEIVSNMGLALQELGRLEEAEARMRQALAMRPDSEDGLNNLGSIYKQMGRFAEATTVLERVLQLHPDFADAYANLGATYLEMGLGERAKEYFHRALTKDPDHAEAHMGLGFCHLQRGEWALGWRYYEWRWKTRSFIPHPHTQTLWQGESISGKTLLVHCEQGFGDAIQFIRLLPGAKELSRARIVVFCPEPLKRLFATAAGMDHLASSLQELPACDYQVPLLSLAQRCAVTLETIPAVFPYLTVDPGWAAPFREDLSRLPGLKVGISWRGNPRHKNDLRRSMDPRHWLPLFQVEGCFLVNLQKDATPEELQLFAGRDHFINRVRELHDFADTAALIAQLDVVIAVDTAVVHLAGALACPTWVMLPAVADWRWLETGTTSPWYLGMRLLRQTVPGHWESCITEAVTMLSQLVRAPEARYNLGNTLVALGRLAEAESCYAEALALRPDFVAALGNRGHVLEQLGRLTEAQETFQTLLRLVPDHAGAFNGLGNVFLARGELDRAREAYHQSIAVDPGSADACYNLGRILAMQRDFPAAVHWYRLAIDLKPAFVQAYYNLGNALVALDDLEEATRQFHRALAIQPGYGEAWYNLGNVLRELRRWDESLAAYDQALALRPDFAEAHFAKGVVYLLLGDAARGWPLYEWRWKKQDFLPHGYDQPQWRGEVLGAGKTLLVHCEQGYGDSIQFIRYLPLVKKNSGARVVLVCPQPLQRLFQKIAAIDQLVTAVADIPPCDSQISLMSLPLVLGGPWSPDAGQYLAISPELGEKFHNLWGNDPRLRVGLVWQGSATHQNDRQRSLDPHLLQPLLNLEGVHFVSLQKEGDWQGFPGHDRVRDCRDLLTDYADTAALIMNLDLVIGVDTSVIHLVGALGRPGWLLLPHVPDWRWQLESDHTPWYPDLRLFRQSRRGDWQEVVARLCVELQRSVDEGGDTSLAGMRP